MNRRILFLALICGQSIAAELDWDRELKTAKAKDSEIGQGAKKLASEGKLKLAEEMAGLKNFPMKGLTERERLVLEKGISNLEFHCLGPEKILGGVGKGLAEALAEVKHLKTAK